MLHQATIENLIEMKLAGMAQALREQADQPDIGQLNFDERLGLLIDRERSHRGNRQLSRRLAVAHFRVSACLEDIDYAPERKLDRILMARLGTGEWIRRARGVLITGATGVGKTWLACALGNAACRRGYTVLYNRVPLLLSELVIARGDGSFDRLWRKLVRTDLLILDDWGLFRSTDQGRRDLLELVEARHERGATLVASQYPVEAWHEILGEPTLADAIIDRLVHGAYRLAPSGESRRKRKAQREAAEAGSI